VQEKKKETERGPVIGRFSEPRSRGRTAISTFNKEGRINGEMKGTISSKGGIRERSRLGGSEIFTPTSAALSPSESH